VFLCNFIFWLGCIQQWLYCVSSSLLTLSLDGGVNVHYSHFIHWYTVSLGVFVRHYSRLGFFLLNYVVISDLIYVLLCLTAKSICVTCLWRWMSVVCCSRYTGTPERAITRSHTELPYTGTQWWMKKHPISQTRTRTIHSSLPMTRPPGSPPFVIFVFYDFLPLVLFCFVVFVSWFFWSFFGSFFLRFVDIIKAYIYVL